MKEDFDYVTMENYTKDTQALTAQSAYIIDNLKEELENAKRLLIAVVRSANEVHIPKRYMEDNLGMISIEEDFCENEFIIKYR